MKYVGLGLILLPFAVIITIVAALVGLREVIVFIVGTGAICVSVFSGVYLANGGTMKELRKIGINGAMNKRVIARRR